MPRRVRRGSLAPTIAFAMISLLAGGTALAALDLRSATVERLDNGLTVILLEDANFPVASVQMLYRIGARNEVSGKTGLAHFLEHMAFRSSENFPDTGLVSSIYALGGEWHGYTWTDQTTYFSTVPKEHLDLLLRIEADRMSRLTIATANMEPERGAVLAEMHMYENDPSSILIDALMFTSFLAHPYRNNTIGWESDIENLQHADVVDFYESHYQPANAVLAIVGDIDRAAALERVEELFGDVARQLPTPLPATVEPVQNGERRIELHSETSRRQFRAGYRAPSVNHPDFAAFLVLQELLGGGSGVSFLQNDWGTPVRRESLLAGVAEEMTTWFPPSAQDYIFVIGGTAPADASELETENTIEQRLAMAREQPVHQSTLDAAIARTLDELVLDIGTTEDAAHQLAFFAGLDALDVLFSLPDKVQGITTADIQRVAQSWLRPERRTIAWHLPRSATVSPVAARAQIDDIDARPLYALAAADLEPVLPAQVRLLGGGIPVVIQPSDLSSSVYLQLIFPGNKVRAESVRTDFPVHGHSSIAFHGRAGDAGTLIKTAREVAATATVVAQGDAQVSADPETRLEQVFLSHMTSPSVTLPKSLAPNLIVVAGDVDTEDVADELESAFGRLQPGDAATSRAATIDKAGISVSLGVPVAQAQLGYIVSAPGPNDRTYEAVRILQYIFAHGYEGRLGKEAISRRGLAYYIDSRYRSDGENGWVTLGIGVDPDRLEALKALLQEELQRLLDEPPGAEEVDEAKSYFLGRAKSSAQSNDELAEALARQWLLHGDTQIMSTLDRRLAAVNLRDVLAAIPAFVSGLTIVIAE